MGAPPATSRRASPRGDLIEMCARCGLEHVDRFGKPSCRAHRSKVRPLQPCRKPPVPGLGVCATHGANGPARAAAARRLALGEARDELDRLGREVDVDPAPAMLAMVREAAGNVAFYRSRVQELDQLTAASIEAESVLAVLGGGGKDGKEVAARAPAGIYGRVDPRNWRAERHVVVALYDEERERLMRFAKWCREAGVEEARLELEIDQARRLADVLRGVVNELLAGVLELVASAGVAVLAEQVREFWAERVPVVVRSQIALVAGDSEAA